MTFRGTTGMDALVPDAGMKSVYIRPKWWEISRLLWDFSIWSKWHFTITL